MHFLFCLLFVLSCAAAPAIPWAPPVGIPTPQFGITETHWMYADPAYKFDYGSGPAPYRANEFGPYTHFVNNTHPAATDKSNPFGSPEKPRATWPYPLPAGSVVQIQGGPYVFKNGPGGKLAFGGNGTEKLPIFIAGVTTNVAQMPAITARECYLFGDWLIVERLHFTNESRVSTRPMVKGAPVLNTAIRDCRFTGSGTTGRGVCVATGGSSGSSATNYTRNLVILRNVMGGYGDWQSANENDACGVIASEYATNIWILDNEMFHMGGDGIRIGADQGGSPTGGFYFVGRNHLHDNRENGLDVKQARHAVISENVMHGFKAGSSSSGEAVVIHYAPEDIWFLDNVIYDAGRGIVSTGIKSCYLIGNRIYECSEYGMQLDRGGGVFHVVNNTIDSCGSGIVTGGQVTELHYLNNIIANITSPTGSHLELNDARVASRSTARAFLFYQPAGGLRIKWAGGRYNSSSAWKSQSRMGDGSGEANPGFTDASRKLSAASPARGRGGPISGYDRIFKSSFGIALFNGNPEAKDSAAKTDIGADVAWFGSANQKAAN